MRTGGMASSPIPQNRLEPSAVFTTSTEAELTSSEPTPSLFPLGCHTIPRVFDSADALPCDVRAIDSPIRSHPRALEPYRQRNSLRGTPGIADVHMTVFGNHPGGTTEMLLEAFSSRFAIGFLARTALSHPPGARRSSRRPPRQLARCLRPERLRRRPRHRPFGALTGRITKDLGY